MCSMHGGFTIPDITIPDIRYGCLKASDQGGQSG
jgi:hypothetical protein